MRMRHLALCAWLMATCGGADAQSLGAQERTARDAERLTAARSRYTSTAQQDGARDERRRRQREALRQTTALLTAQQDQNAQLERRVRALDDDLAQLQAVTISTLQAQRARLQGSPLVADRADLVDRIDALADQPASLDVLYTTWFALHEEWLAGGHVARAEQPVTFADGVRRSATVTRYGGIALGHDGAAIAITPDAGLVARAPAMTSGVSANYLQQQIYDSGAIGVALLLCALVALIIIVRRRGQQFLGLIASASLLLGLLGTVVGLIHTFRALARYGGADASVAAAGISHALATTWMGLVIAIALMLIGPLVATFSPPRTRQPAPLARPGARSTVASRGPIALALAVLLSVALFYLMQWLTQRPLSPPPPVEPVVRVQRIDWSTPPPPPPPPAEVPETPAALPTTAAFALPAQTPLAAPRPGLDAPALNIAPSLPGLGGDGLPAAGTLWRGASSGQGIIEGKDLVPISSARPRYPKAAMDAGIDGWVEAIFRINASGRVSDVRIIDAEPPGVFEQAAAQALERWLYAPLYRDGKPVAREATQLLRFVHSEARDTYTDDER